MSTTQLLHDRLQVGQVSEEWIRLEALHLVRPPLRLIDGAVQVTPELISPLLHEIRFHKAGENEVAVELKDGEPSALRINGVELMITYGGPWAEDPS